MDDAGIFDDIVTRRRAVRIFNPDVPVPNGVIERSVRRAVLSPNSSNLQLWEFYWVRSPEKKEQMRAICLHQNAAKTAQELVVIVTRKDLWQQRCAAIIDQQVQHFKDAFGEPLGPTQKRVLLYWQRVVPLLYRSGFGLFDLGKPIVAWLRGWFTPTPRQVTSRHMLISAHRSVALAAMTFMHSVSAEGFDSCPLEGFDSARLKSMLGLGWSAQIAMVVAVGKRGEKGVYGPRFRLPLDEVFHKV